MENTLLTKLELDDGVRKRIFRKLKWNATLRRLKLNLKYYNNL